MLCTISLRKGAIEVIDYCGLTHINFHRLLSIS
jgi:hypothetical protein